MSRRSARVIFASLGRVAQNFTDPASAQRAYKLAASLLKERKGEIRVDTLPEETVKPVVSEATAAVQAGGAAPERVGAAPERVGAAPERIPDDDGV